MSNVSISARLLGVTAALLTVLVPSAWAQGPNDRGDTLEITSQRIDQLLKGLKGEKPVREQIAKSSGAVGQHPGQLTDAEIAKIQECGKAEMQRRQEQIKASQQGMDPKQVEQMNREAKKKSEEAAKRMQKRMQEIAMSGDAEALQRFQDSIRGASAQRLGGESAGCGSLEANASPAQLAQIDQAGAQSSGLPPGQYVILRNRVATYFRTGGADFSKEEKKTFEKRARDLTPYAIMLGTSPR
jgi:DNA-binding PadR family transcriptional regulator